MIKIENLYKAYGELNVLNGINLTIQDHAITALIGANGAGKSTLLSVLARFISKDSGKIEIDSLDAFKIEPSAFAKKVSILKQTHHITANITVRELVSFGRFPYSRGNLKETDLNKVEEALTFLNLKDIEHKNIQHLSGGQRQRAYVAMTVAQDTDYILLDEPLNNLDMRYAVELMHILKELVEKLNKTIVIVIHDINIASAYADHIVALKDGVIYKEGTPDEMMHEAILDAVFDHHFDIALHEGVKYCVYR